MTVTSTLKVAGKGLTQVPVTIGVATHVSQDMVTEPCTSQAGTPIDGPLLAADEAYTTGIHVERPIEATVQVLERSYTTSYLIPEKLKGRPVQFLVDTGCTTNLLSKQVFDKLSERVRNCLDESDSHGTMADSTQLPFYGILRLPLRVRDESALL